jgi:hypothetical protein
MSSPYVCSFCQKHVSSKCYLSRHVLTCKKKEGFDLTSEIHRLHAQLRQQKEENQQQLLHMQCEYEQRLQAQELHYTKELERVQQQFAAERQQKEMLQNQIFEIAKQPTTMSFQQQHNPRTINIINQLGPYLKPEDMQLQRLLDDNFNEEIFQGGPDKIAEFTARYLLTDPDTRKPRVMCTDVSRRVFRYVDPETRELQIDHGFQKTHQLLRHPLEQANLRVYRDVYLGKDPDDVYRNQWKENDEFIIHPSKFPDKVHFFLTSLD